MTPLTLEAVLEGDQPERPVGALGACRVFAWRGLRRIRVIPAQLIDATVGPILLLLSFTFLFGGAIEGSTGVYLQFVLPGVLVMAVLQTATYAGSELAADRTRGVVDRFRTMPIWPSAPLVGAVAAGIARAAIASIVVLALGFVLGFEAEGGPVGIAGALALVLAFTAAVSWVFTTLGLALGDQSAAHGAGTTAVFIAVFVSNVFVDPETLPAVLEAVVTVNPVSHLTTAARGLLGGEAAVADVALVLGEAAVLIAIFAPLTLRGYRRA